MATFIDTFASSTVGAAPTGWTRQWNASDSPLVVADATALEGKHIRMPAANGRRFYSFDAAGTPTDYEILTRARISVSNLGRFWMAGRGDPTVDCVQAGVYNGATSTTMARYVNGGGGLLSGASTYNPNIQVGQWFRQRVRVSGNQAWYKAWTDEANEPAGWNIGPLTDTVMPQVAGWVGIMVDAGGDGRDFDWFSVGTNGDTAPDPTVAPEPELLPPAGLTATPFADRVELSWSAVAEADSYDIDRDEVVIITGLTATQYVDRGVAPGDTPSYRVRSGLSS